MNEVDIFDYIKSNIDQQYINIVEFALKKSKNKAEEAYFVTVKAQPTPWRLDATEKSLAKIKIGKKSSYIAFSLSCGKKLKEYSIDYAKIKSEDLLRVSFETFSNLSPTTIKELFTFIMLDAFSFQTFGCCGKYKECTEKGYCVHQDLLYATACQYRRIISKEVTI